MIQKAIDKMLGKVNNINYSLDDLNQYSLQVYGKKWEDLTDADRYALQTRIKATGNMKVR